MSLRLRLSLVHFAALFLVGCVACAAPVGIISVSLDHGQALLRWTNAPGQAYVIETAELLASGGIKWTNLLTLTGDASMLEWAEDRAADRAAFYRISLATSPAPYQSLQSALARGCTNQGIIGASAAAVLTNYGLWIGTFGTSDGSKAIRPQTPFEAGSVTKTVVAATVLKLAEEGKLKLDDPISAHLPGLNWPNISPSITIRQLLGHRSGVYNFGDDGPFRQALFADWSRAWKPEEVLPFVTAPYFQPGADGQYSNTGYVLLGLIIRAATGREVAAEMRRTVIGPAGLRSTWMGAEEAWPRPLANPHLDFDGDGVHEDLGAKPQTAILTSFWTSGAQISTAPDLARLGIALFEGNILTGASLDAMRAFQSIVAGTRVDYGLGLIRYNIIGRDHWCHSGGLFGEYAWFSYCPSTRTSLGVAYNYPVTKTGANLPGELLIALYYLNSGSAQPAALAAEPVRELNIPLVP